jgi:hypothetical protein
MSEQWCQALIMCFSGFGWDKGAHDQQTAHPFSRKPFTVLSALGCGGENANNYLTPCPFQSDLCDCKA